MHFLIVFQCCVFVVKQLLEHSTILADNFLLWDFYTSNNVDCFVNCGNLTTVTTKVVDLISAHITAMWFNAVLYAICHTWLYGSFRPDWFQHAVNAQHLNSGEATIQTENRMWVNAVPAHPASLWPLVVCACSLVSTRFDFHSGSFASNLEQVANHLCHQVNSASYPQRDGKWGLRGEGLVGAVVRLLAAPRIQKRITGMPYGTGYNNSV